MQLLTTDTGIDAASADTHVQPSFPRVSQPQGTRLPQMGALTSSGPFLSHRLPFVRWHSLGTGLSTGVAMHGPGLRATQVSQRLALPSPGNIMLPEASSIQVTLDHSGCLAMAGGDASEQTAQGCYIRSWF